MSTALLEAPAEVRSTCPVTNPVVSLVDAAFGGLSRRDALAYIPAQIAGCITGAIVANAMFALADLAS